MNAIISGLLFASLARAQSSVCLQSIPPEIEKRIVLPHDASWFIRSAYLTGEIGISTGVGNQILDVNSEKFSAAPGTVDAVLSPDGKLMFTPMKMLYNPKAKTFVDISDDAASKVTYHVDSGAVSAQDLSGNSAAAHISVAELKRRNLPFVINAMYAYVRGSGGPKVGLADRDIEGAYQSIGLVKTAQSENRYRLLVEGDQGLMSRDYILDNKSGSLRTASPFHLACPGLQSPSLPMISKDGTEFSYYEPGSGKTIIRALGDGSSCEKRDEIPAMVGKVDFSPDKKLLAFHIDENFPAYEFNRAQQQNDLGAYIFDRASKSLIPLSVRSDEDSYYPVFLSNEEVAFISTKKGIDDKDLMSITVAKIRADMVPSCANCALTPENTQARALLGLIYNDQCKIGNGSFSSAIASAAKLSPESCHALLKSYDDEKIQAIYKARKAGDEKLWGDTPGFPQTLGKIDAFCGASTPTGNAPVKGSR